MNKPLTQQITVHADLSPHTHEALSGIPVGRVRSALIQKVLEDHFSMKGAASRGESSFAASSAAPAATPPTHKLNFAVEDSEFDQTFADYFDEK